MAVGALGVEPILEQTADIAGRTFDAAHAVYFLDAVFGDVNSGQLGLSVMKPNGRWGQSQHFQWLRFVAAWADQQDQAKPAAIYFRATMPFRTVLRELGLTSNQVWGLAKTDPEWSEKLEGPT